jgi:hypothetical protein
MEAQGGVGARMFGGAHTQGGRPSGCSYFRLLALLLLGPRTRPPTSPNLASSASASSNRSCSSRKVHSWRGSRGEAEEAGEGVGA